MSKYKKTMKKLIEKMPVLRNMYRHYQWSTELKLLNGENPSENTHPSILHFTLNRSASQWVKSVLRRHAVREEMVHVQWNEMAFNSEHPFLDHLDSVEEYKQIFRPEGYLYSAYGGYPKGIPEINKYKVVLVIRDPRDILVSRYFSIRDSHSPPPPESNKRESFFENRALAREVSIDEFVLQKSSRLREQYHCYIDCLLDRHTNVHVTRYEDMVADVSDWLDRLLEYVELSPDQKLRTEIIEEAEQIQSKEEDETVHNRKGRPGDHIEKLQLSTTEELNDVFGFVIDRFGYTKNLHSGE